MRNLISLVMVSLVFGYPAWALEPVTIGICVPLSGHLADRGHAVLRGLKIALRMRPSVLGRPVVFAVANTHSELADSSAAVLSLVDGHKVAAIIGDFTPGTAVPGLARVERRGIAVVAPFATSQEKSREAPGVFRTCAIDRDQGCLAATIARSHTRARTAGLVFDLSRNSSVECSRSFTRAFAKTGGIVTVQARMKTGDRDFTPQLQQIKAAKPDTIYAPISCTECALLARQARAMGIHVPILAAHHAHDPELLALGGASVENLVFTTHIPAASRRNFRGERFAAACQFYLCEQPHPEQIVAAEAYFMLLDAIEQAGSAQPGLIGKALSCPRSCEAMTGKIVVGTDGTTARRLFVNQVKRGRFVPYDERLPQAPHAVSVSFERPE